MLFKPNYKCNKMRLCTYVVYVIHATKIILCENNNNI